MKEVAQSLLNEYDITAKNYNTKQSQIITC